MNLPLLRRILRALLLEIRGSRNCELDVHLVDTSAITLLNETYLSHKGATDVIAFDYSGGRTQDLQGEVFVCVPVAVAQARSFRTTWQHEVLRYVVHGVLHLCGHDDRTPARRRKMKAAEDAVLHKLCRQFYVRALEAPSRP